MLRAIWEELRNSAVCKWLCARDTNWLAVYSVMLLTYLTIWHR